MLCNFNAKAMLVLVSTTVVAGLSKPEPAPNLNYTCAPGQPEVLALAPSHLPGCVRWLRTLSFWVGGASFLQPKSWLFEKGAGLGGAAQSKRKGDPTRPLICIFIFTDRVLGRICMPSGPAWLTNGPLTPQVDLFFSYPGTPFIERFAALVPALFVSRLCWNACGLYFRSFCVG